MNINISYIWPHSESLKDGQFGTGITFVRGVVYSIDAGIATKMLRHVDVYQRADNEKASVDYAAPGNSDEDIERQKMDDAQGIRDAIGMMDKTGLREYIKTNWQQDVDGRQSVEAIRIKAASLFDQYGLP